MIHIKCAFNLNYMDMTFSKKKERQEWLLMRCGVHTIFLYSDAESTPSFYIVTRALEGPTYWIEYGVIKRQRPRLAFVFIIISLCFYWYSLSHIFKIIYNATRQHCLYKIFNVDMDISFFFINFINWFDSTIILVIYIFIYQIHICWFRFGIISVNWWNYKSILVWCPDFPFARLGAGSVHETHDKVCSWVCDGR